MGLCVAQLRAEPPGRLALRRSPARAQPSPARPGSPGPAPAGIHPRGPAAPRGCPRGQPSFPLLLPGTRSPAANGGVLTPPPPAPALHWLRAGPPPRLPSRGPRPDSPPASLLRLPHPPATARTLWGLTRTGVSFPQPHNPGKHRSTPRESHQPARPTAQETEPIVLIQSQSWFP